MSDLKSNLDFAFFLSCVTQCDNLHVKGQIDFIGKGVVLVNMIRCGAIEMNSNDENVRTLELVLACKKHKNLRVVQ